MNYVMSTLIDHANGSVMAEPDAMPEGGTFVLHWVSHS